MKQNEEVILEEQPIRNIQMEDVLQKSLDFNKQYIQYLKTRLEERLLADWDDEESAHLVHIAGNDIPA